MILQQNYLHASLFLNDLLHLRDSDIMCDFTIIVNGKKLRCHKLVLAVESHYFRTLFMSSLKESSQDKIELHGVEFDSISTVVDYFYTSRIEITEVSIGGILEVIDLLQVTSLRPLVCQFFSEALDVSNCLSIYVLANQRQYVDSSIEALHFAFNHFRELHKETDFLESTWQTFQALLRSRALFFKTKTTVLRAIYAWVKFDLEARKIFVPLIIMELRKKNYEDRHMNLLMLLTEDKIDIGLYTQLSVYAETNDYFMEVASSFPNLEVCIVIGGLTRVGDPPLRSAEVYVPNENRWSYSAPVLFEHDTAKPGDEYLPTMDQCRHSAAYATVCNFIYIIGGCSGDEVLSSVERYDVVKNEWKLMPSLPEALEQAAATAVDKNVYVSGGYTENNEVMDKTWVLYEGHTAWKEFIPLRNKRRSHGLIAVHGVLYAIGGIDETGTPMNSVECLFVGHSSWIAGIPIPISKAHFALVRRGSDIFIIGCSKQPGTVERYDTSLNTCLSVSPMVNSYQCSVGAALLNGKILCSGGRSNIQPYNNHVYKFNSESTNVYSWVIAPYMNRPRAAHVMTTIYVLERSFDGKVHHHSPWNHHPSFSISMEKSISPQSSPPSSKSSLNTLQRVFKED